MLKVLATTLLRPDGGTAKVFGHDVIHEADTVRGPGEPDRPVLVGG